METRPSLLRSTLAKLGPSLTSIIARELMTHGISAQNARKIIERRGEGISTLAGVRFPHNERFIYLDQHANSQQYWRSLLRAFKTQKTAYAAALAGLEAHGNIIAAKRFHVISGSPLKLKRHVSSFRLLQILKRTGILVDHIVAGQHLISVNPDTDFDVLTAQEYKSRAVAEKVAFSAINDWSRKIGLISHDAGTFYKKHAVPQFSQFAWDFTAPSYISALTDFRGDKVLPGFFVADVVLGLELNRDHIEFFLRKVATITALRRSLQSKRMSRSVRPFIAMMVADRFAPDAFRAGKERGLLFVTPSALFGEDVGAALRGLIDTLTNAAAVAKSNPDRIPELFSALARLESSAASLRGPLFEMIVAHLMSRRGGWIEVGQILTDTKTGKTAEADVLAINGQEITAIECKGHRFPTQVSLETVERWMTRQIPRMRRALNHRNPGKKLRFEFWTTGKFADDALQFLKAKSESEDRYSLGWLDHEAVLAELERTAVDHLANVVKQYYVKPPIYEVVVPVDVSSGSSDAVIETEEVIF